MLESTRVDFGGLIRMPSVMNDELNNHGQNESAVSNVR